MWTQYGKTALYTLNCTSLAPSKFFAQITKAWKMRLELSVLWHRQRQWQLKNGIHKGYLNPSNSNIYIQDSPDWSLYTGFKPFYEQKNSMIFKDTLPMFQGLHSVQKRALSLSFLVLPQHEQFRREGLSVFAAFRHLRIWVG